MLTQLRAESNGNHSTIAAVQQLCAWNGLAMVAADRNNVETNPTTGLSVIYGGSASIWQADGRRTGHLPATEQNLTLANPGAILYGEIDPALYVNDQKATLRRRRPELYGDLAFYRAPTDTKAATQSHAITVTAVQYAVVAGDSDGNLGRANEQVLTLQAGGAGDGIVVFPAFTLTGAPATPMRQPRSPRRAWDGPFRCSAISRSGCSGSSWEATSSTTAAHSSTPRFSSARTGP